MRKTGRKNKNYSPDFKINVIMDMRNNHLGYSETMKKYFSHLETKNFKFLEQWERIYLEEGAKGNCIDNGAMENFFGRLKVEMFYGEKFESVNAFISELEKYINYYNNERISMKLKGMSPVQYRTHSQSS